MAHVHVTFDQGSLMKTCHCERLHFSRGHYWLINLSIMCEVTGHFAVSVIERQEHLLIKPQYLLLTTV